MRQVMPEINDSQQIGCKLEKGSVSSLVSINGFPLETRLKESFPLWICEKLLKDIEVD